MDRTAFAHTVYIRPYRKFFIANCGDTPDLAGVYGAGATLCCNHNCISSPTLFSRSDFLDADKILRPLFSHKMRVRRKNETSVKKYLSFYYVSVFCLLHYIKYLSYTPSFINQKQRFSC